MSLLSLKDLAAFVVENAQSYGSMRPRNICGGDDSRRHVRYPNIDFPQSCRSAIRRRADKLDSERVRRSGDDGRQFRFRRQLWKGPGFARRQSRKGSAPARRGVFSIGNENGVHC